MIKREIGELGGDKLTYCQAESIDEAQREGFPQGLYFCWEYKGERIFSPGKIISMVQDSVRNGVFEPQKLINKNDIQKVYNELVSNQKKNIVEQLTKILKRYENENAPKEVIEAIKNTIESYKNQVFPDRDGIVRPNRKQAESLAGSEEQLKSIFDSSIIEREFGR